MEHTIGEHTYRVGRIDALKQFHIVRRLGPIFGELAPALRGATGNAEADVLTAVPAVMGAFAKLSDDDMNYCLFGLLAVVERKQPTGLGWGPVSTGHVLAYSDIAMTQMLQLAWVCLQQNLSGFFAALPSDLRALFRPPSGQSVG